MAPENACAAELLCDRHEANCLAYRIVAPDLREQSKRFAAALQSFEGSRRADARACILPRLRRVRIDLKPDDVFWCAADPGWAYGLYFGILATCRLAPSAAGPHHIGEIRGAEAFTFLRAINSGHPGSLTTVHADTPARAAEQLALMVLQSGTQLWRDDVLKYVGGAVDIFVQLERGEGRRWVSQVEWKDATDTALNDRIGPGVRAETWSNNL